MNNNYKTTSNFYAEIPFIRSIGCILVVITHLTATFTVDHIANYPILILNQYSRLGTPLFAVISAFLLTSSVKERSFNLKKFALSRTTKIIIPYIFWTCIYLIVKQLSGKNPFKGSKNFLDYFISGSGFFHLYFMVTIIEFYLLFPLIQMVRNRKFYFILFLISVPINYLWVSRLKFSYNSDVLKYIMVERSFILKWISFFLFGGVFAHYYDIITTFAKKQFLFLVALFSLVLIGTYIEINPSKIFTSSRPANILYIPIFLLFLSSVYFKFVKNSIASKALNFIGNYSMGIYLVHPLVKIVLIRVLPFIFKNQRLISVQVILLILVSILFIRLILFLPKSNYIITVGKFVNDNQQQKELHLLNTKNRKTTI